jgi:hypothetical protein
MKNCYRTVILGIPGLLAALACFAAPETDRRLAADMPMPWPMRPAVQDLTGVYEGFSQRVGEHEPFPVFSELMIVSQDHRRFEGEFVPGIGAPAELLHLAGTVAASGNVLAEGGSATLGIIVQWSWGEFSPGAAILQGRSRTTRSIPIEQFRSSILLRDFAFDDSNPPADVSGTYEGRAVSALDGQVQLWMLDSRRHDESRTGFVGELMRGDEAGIVIDNSRFTVNGDGELVLIGAGSGVHLQVLARFFNPQPDPPGAPARIEGIYMIHSLSDPDDKSLGGPDTVEDVGTFMLVRTREEGETIPPGIE